MSESKIQDKCPFCGARPSGPNRWACGTSGPLEENGEDVYATGVVCDRDCFRDALLVCHAQLKDLESKYDKLVEAMRLVRGDLIRHHSPFVFDQNYKYINEALAESEGVCPEGMITKWGALKAIVSLSTYEE